VAAFTATPTNLSVAVNGSASTDSDGSIVSYSWNWGDGTAAGTGANASHTYGAPGPYPVTLTVTDNGALTNALTKTVTVTSPLPSTFLAQDDFQRTIASGWGTSDVGGAWTVLYGAASSATVNGSQGVLSLAAGNTRQVVLQSSVAQNTSSTIVFSLNTAPSTGSAYVGLVARQHANADDNYTVRVWLKNDGTVWLVTQRGGTVVQSALVPGLTRVAGDTFNLRVDVTGVSPTTISSKIWKVGTAEPASAQLTTTDNTAVLQSAGFVGVNGNRSGSATSTGVVTFDTFRVTDLG
jgi:PKD repeat protein